MLVAGGAVSEKRGQPDRFDRSMLRPPDPAAYRAKTPAGEAAANAAGWVPLLRKWFDIARRPTGDVLAAAALDPNDPPAIDLSRGLAFLLELPPPVPQP